MVSLTAWSVPGARRRDRSSWPLPARFPLPPGPAAPPGSPHLGPGPVQLPVGSYGSYQSQPGTEAEASEALGPFRSTQRLDADRGLYAAASRQRATGAQKRAFGQQPSSGLGPETPFFSIPAFPQLRDLDKCRKCESATVRQWLFYRTFGIQRTGRFR